MHKNCDTFDEHTSIGCYTEAASRKRCHLAEILPIASGIVMGAMLVYVRRALRLRVVVALSILLGTFASVASGEFNLNPSYLFFGSMLVAGSALASMVLGRRNSWTPASQRFHAGNRSAL